MFLDQWEQFSGNRACFRSRVSECRFWKNSFKLEEVWCQNGSNECSGGISPPSGRSWELSAGIAAFFYSRNLQQG